jgi:hypothetical protein
MNRAFAESVAVFQLITGEVPQPSLCKRKGEAPLANCNGKTHTFPNMSLLLQQVTGC